MKVFMTRFDNGKVVSGDIGGNISLADFKILYMHKGVDYEEIGRSSIATDNLLKSIEAKFECKPRQS